MKIFRFNNYNNINEGCKAASLSGSITLYRLTSHDVVDLSNPGEYYVCDKADISPDFLEKKGEYLYLITVECDSSNVDVSASESECAKLGADCIVAVKNDDQCDVITVEPYSFKTNEEIGYNYDDTDERTTRIKNEIRDFLENSLESDPENIFDNNDRLVLMSDVIRAVFEWHQSPKW